MIRLHKAIATVFGIGYVGKGGGSIAAAVCCILWMMLPAGFTDLRQVILAVVVTGIGVWSGNVADKIWGKDSSKVVIDEVAGMLVALLFFPAKLKLVVAAFILFRFFDIAKPLFIKKMEMLPKGWGVMADDILAGIYANILLKVIVIFQIL